MGTNLETAVCNVCGWEGLESDVDEFGLTADICPKCGNDSVNYFSKPSQPIKE